MKSVVSFALILASFSVQGEILKSRIHSIEQLPENGNHLVKFSNGRVGFIEGVNKSLQSQISRLKDEMVEAELDEKSSLLRFKTIKPLEIELRSERAFENNPPEYTPTVVSMKEVQEMFKRMNADYKRRSECSDRAHVWAWEEFKNSGLMSEKVFAFFTASYIDRHRFKWWFHVAPLISVRNGNKIEKMVMDYQFMDRPSTIKQWTDLLVFSKRNCKMTTKFSEYDVNPQTEDCYMMIDSMYYRLPGELHAQELQGQYKSEWNHSEVRAAYGFAFKTLREVIP